MLNRLLYIAVVATSLATANSAHAMGCDELSAFQLPNITITTSQTVASGNYTKTGLQTSVAANQLPTFCRVAATLTPVKNSSIKIEVWMPNENWNGRFQAVGNGGFAGSISYAAMIDALAAGYVTASTDTGHTGSVLSASWALNHPEQVIDYGYRAVHEMTVAAKVIINLFYERSPHHSYWNGCSQGGGQAFAEVQRYPKDYDGIIAGAPNNNMTHVRMSGTWTMHAIHKDPASFIADKKLAAINHAVVEACDDIDGVEDGIIDDPRSCAFDIARLKCTAEESDSCLTVPQLIGLQKIYSGTRGRHNNELLYPGFTFGSELQWAGQITGDTTPSLNQHHLKQNGFFKYIVYNDEQWDWRTFDFRVDPDKVDEAMDSIVNNNNTNLKAFKARGGKLLQYHGWYDPAISPLDSIRYFEDVQRTMKSTSKFYRLFMIPGMGHCGGGPGASNFDKMNAIVQWVEKGKAPVQIVASKSEASGVSKTKLLCSYPQTAKYNGTGSTDNANNFSCVERR